MLKWECCGKNIALDVARGLHFLHNHGVVHFDLRSHNILLSREGTAKITDVGLARITEDVSFFLPAASERLSLKASVYQYVLDDM